MADEEGPPQGSAAAGGAEDAGDNAEPTSAAANGTDGAELEAEDSQDADSEELTGEEEEPGDGTAQHGTAGEGGHGEGPLDPVPEDAALQPPGPPPYVPPEVGDDYIPVAELPPLPPVYNVNEDGRPVPLPGVESLFLTGTTMEMFGLQALGSDKEGGKLMMNVPREDILKDVQFRGAISDFYAYKQKLLDADYDPLCIRVNEDDVYGDGNNFQLACRKEAAERWTYVEQETARRRQLLIDEELRAAAERAKPRSKKARKVKPWVSLGSEVEIEDASVRPRREPITVLVSRMRREFYQPFRHGDKDAHELWNSSQMECRPFKDPNFELRKLQQDASVQAVVAVAERGAQAGGVATRPAAAQYVPRTLPAAAGTDAALDELVQSGFLERAVHQCELALIQNEVANIFTDDFAALADEEGLTSSRKESTIAETQSFTHLTYSKNKVVSAIQWLPHRRGVVAVACTEAMSATERVARAGRPSNAYILIWNFKDSIHPESVLQAPYEVFAFRYNPCNPDIVVAGCYNGQMVVWDTSLELDKSGKARARQGEGGQSGEEPNIPVIKHRYLTTIDFSHQSIVMDVKWLPGVEISSRGRVSRAADGLRECNFFATTAGDGKVNFWDVRVERLARRGRKAEDSSELVWKPTHSLHLISIIGMDLSGLKLSFRAVDLERGLFHVSSSDGELVAADFIKPEGEDNPDYVRSITQAHLGPIVSLEASPFYDDITLTVGDWSFQIWRDGQTTPLFSSSYAPDCYTCGCWSPSRPAVLYLADNSGNIEVWDLLDRSHEPSIRSTLASTAIMSMSFMDAPAAGTAGAAPAGAPAAAPAAAQPAGAAAPQQQAAAQFLALGDSAGVLRIVELPRNLRRPVTNEKKLMAGFLDREAERVADVAARKPTRDAANKALEEAQKKAQEEAEAAAKDSAAKDQSATAASAKAAAAQQASNAKAAAAQAAAAQAQQALVDEKAETEYLKLEQRFKVQLGLVAQETA